MTIHDRYALVAMAGEAVNVVRLYGAGVCSAEMVIEHTWRVAFDLSADSVEQIADRNLKNTITLAKTAAVGLRDLGMTDMPFTDSFRSPAGYRSGEIAIG